VKNFLVLPSVEAMVDTPKWKVLAHGQLISLLIAGTGVFATFLSSTHPSSNFPTLMNLCNYILMSSFLLCLRGSSNRGCDGDDADGADAANNDRVVFKRDANNNLAVFTPIPNGNAINSVHNNESDNYRGAITSGLHQQQSVQADYEDRDFEARYLTDKTEVIRRRYLYAWYFFAALLDLEANYLVISAYNYTTITSVMLLDCFTIPSAMLLSYNFLGYRYQKFHFAGAALCIAGLGLIVLSDTLQGSNDIEARNPLLGDIFCLCGAFLYASSNVLQEHLVKQYGRRGYIGHVGAFGVLLASIQFAALDMRRMLKDGSKLPLKGFGYMVGFVGCLFGMYVNTSVFLIQGDATLFNLSLLTSDVYAVVFSYFMYHRLVHWLYFLAFAFVAVGLAVYHRVPSPDTEKKDARVVDGVGGDDDNKGQSVLCLDP
jgi:drug/metabolite transporter (DMT)-like permease